MLLQSMLREVDIIKFLATKVPDDRLAYRPTPAQRTTLELLQYLSCCGLRITEVVLKQDPSLRDHYGKESEEVTLQSFPGAMDRQASRLKALFDKIPENEFATKEVALPWGVRTTIEGLVLNASLKFMVAYRMQLFLYLKGMGRTELSTVELWLGKDPEQATA